MALAALIVAVVQSFTIGVIAPKLPRVVGPPDVVRSKNFRVSKAAAFRLNNADGAVMIESHNADDIVILATIHAYTQDESDNAAAERYVDSLVVVNVEPDRVVLTTEPGDRPDFLDLRVDYAVVVPTGTDVTVDGANGNVKIAKGCGEVAVYGGNTDIDITRPLGGVIAKSTNGRIRVYDASHDATIETVNGNVYTHMQGGSLWATTTNGAIVTRVLKPDVARCNLSSLNGGITLTLAQGCSARMDASTDRGIVRSDLPVRYTEGGNRRRHVRGDIGDGRTKVSMETVNGSIWIMRD